MLHQRDDVRGDLLDSVFSSQDLSVSMPKYTMPDEEHEARHAFQVVKDELMLDGNSRQNLATFCQTWIEPEIRDLMDLSIDKNMIDKDEYPQTAELEERCVHMLADLWNSPEATNTIGTSTTGSSEAAMLGGMSLLWQWRARQRHFIAMPPSMQASLEPIVEVPSVFAASGEFQRSASMCTQRDSSSAVCGYSSLSIMFLSIARSMILWTSASSQVWQNVARF